MQSKKETKRYLKEIGALLPSSKKEKKEFMAALQEVIANYEAEANVEADYEQLVLYFGKPSTIAQEYADIWGRELCITKKRNKSLRKIILFICVLIVLACIIWLTCDFIQTFLKCSSIYKFYSQNI